MLRTALGAVRKTRLRLNHCEPTAPGLTFTNWPAPEGLVPADGSLAGLVSFAPRLPPPDALALRDAHPVFLLDSWRLAYRFDDPEEGTFDNRYMLMPADLPDPEALRAANERTSFIALIETAEGVAEVDKIAALDAWNRVRA